MSFHLARSLGERAMQLHMRHYSVASKRVVAAARQQQRAPSVEPGTTSSISSSGAAAGSVAGAQGRVPKFTMARAEFLAADLFARHRQVVEPVVGSSGGGEAAQRGSFRTAGELGWLSRGGLTAEEAGVPHARLRQIYAAPASVYMRVTPDALIPEAMRLGPLAEPLLGEDPFGGGLASLRLTGDDAADFADEFFDAILRNSAHETAEPAEGYCMTSVRRKRATKMNKHKHKKLRKRTRALRKRLGK